MHYYSQFGHNDFILCLGYKANVIKEYFLNYKPQTYADCVISGFGKRIDILGEAHTDWRVALIDTGMWRNVGERLWAVREHVADQEMFLANYSDGLCDIDLTEMIEIFRASGKIACFTAVRPTFSLHMVDMEPSGKVERIRASQDANLWINGGFFIFRQEMFDYIREGEELVEAPFQRLIEADQLMAFRHEGFWRPMDTLKDKEVLEDLVDKGTMPWVLNKDFAAGCVGPYNEQSWMKSIELAHSGERLSILCIGAHADDIEIGAGATILGWIGRGVRLDVHWVVLSAHGQRADEARSSACAFLADAARSVIDLAEFKDGFFPYQGADIKVWFEALKRRTSPDLILCHFRNDGHQDHREVSHLTWNTFRDHVILEYEIPKWDGDLGQPNVFVPASKTLIERKAKLLHDHFGTQRSKGWFDAQTFIGLARLRGVECRAPDGFAEHFTHERSWCGEQR